MITLPAEKMASRVAASLLNAAGLPDLVCSDLQECVRRRRARCGGGAARQTLHALDDDARRYEDMAVSLALDMDKLLAIRRRLEQGRVT